MTTIFDVAMLDREVEVVTGDDPGSALLRAFHKPRTRYAVVMEHARPGDFGLVIGRGRLYADLIDLADLNRDERELWARLLVDDPDALSGLVAKEIIHQLPTYSPRDRFDIRMLDAGTRRNVGGFLSHWLRDYDRLDLRARVVDVDAKPASFTDPPLIAISGDRVIGVYQPDATASDLKEMLSRRDSSSGHKTAAMPPMPPMQPSPAGGPPDGAVESAAGNQPPSPFIAHPRLDAPGLLKREQEFAFTVGYSDRPDPDADSQQGFNIPNPVEDDTMLIVATAEGARVHEPWNVRLPLDLVASREFKATVDPGAPRVRLHAKYFYRGRPVGHIVKSVAIEGVEFTRGAAPAFNSEVIAKFSPQLSHYEDIAPIDIVLMVQKRKDGQVAWHALVTADDRIFGEYLQDLPDTGIFARGLAGLRKLHGDRGDAPRDELNNQAQLIGQLIPPEILSEVLAPAIKAGKPDILLMTDEPYVPWELSLLGPPYLDAPAFLFQVARIGRWWTGDSLGGPPSSRAIRHISTVAATEYREEASVTPLKNANLERNWLVQQALRGPVHDVEAIRPEVDKWLAIKPQPDGHLAHIALHGFSDTQAQDQGLILGDGAVLTPGRLIGAFFPGQKPRFDMVFLNACQVGTAGQRLGRIGGFPGAVLRGGGSAFIGPLWEVDDGVARVVAENFYTRVFREHKGVAEALQEIRELPELKDSITPWAYLYYGHPALTLT